MPPPPAQDRRIEFIGDSDSVGFGNLSGRRNCTGEEVFLSTDTQEAFGPRVARFFDADYRLNAVSGIGLVRNIQGADPERTMRSLYGRALFDSTVSAPPSNWSPQVIVVALGSNDFFSDLAATERWSDLAELRNDFVMQYVEFFLELRHRHPRAYLLSLAWDGYGPDYLMAHEAAISDLRDRGETSLDLMILPEMAKTGCLWHPDLADHEKVSNAIIRFLEARPEIWVN